MPMIHPTETHTISLLDDGAEVNTWYQVEVAWGPSGVTVEIVQNIEDREVYVGVEIWDGALRALMGPTAEITMNDNVGTIIEERIDALEITVDDSVEGSY
jgi:hypothetical protein